MWWGGALGFIMSVYCKNLLIHLFIELFIRKNILYGSCVIEGY